MGPIPASGRATRTGRPWRGGLTRRRTDPEEGSSDQKEPSMSQDARDGSPNIFPAIRYRDAPAAIAWLGRAFGLESRMEVPNPDGSIAHAELGIGPGAIMMGSKRANPDPTNPWDAVVQGIYVAVD